MDPIRKMAYLLNDGQENEGEAQSSWLADVAVSLGQFKSSLYFVSLVGFVGQNLDK